MKKTLLRIGAAAAVATVAHGQGALDIETYTSPHSAGFNTATSNPLLSNGYFTGTVSLELFSVAYSATALSEAQQINADDALGTAAANGAAQYMLWADFTQQAFGPNIGDEALMQSFSVSDGYITALNGVVETVGSSSTLTSGSEVLYAILVSGGGLSAAYVLDNVDGYEAGGGAFAVPMMGADMPDQNILLESIPFVPEPTPIALAGLGGLSVLILRRLRA